MFGLGMMGGPFLGGVLYELGGFYLPFVVCGGALVGCTLLGCFLFRPGGMRYIIRPKVKNKAMRINAYLTKFSSVEEGSEEEISSVDSDTSSSSKTTFSMLLRIPAIVYSCFVLCISDIRLIQDVNRVLTLLVSLVNLNNNAG